MREGSDVNHTLSSFRKYLVKLLLNTNGYHPSNEFINPTSKYPEKKKELERLANSLSENDNPVLMLVKLKE